MFKWIRNKRKGDGGKLQRVVDTGEQSEDVSDKMSKETIEISRWQRQARRDARQEAAKGQGFLKIGSPEEQMKRLSEQIAREVQQRRGAHN